MQEITFQTTDHCFLNGILHEAERKTNRLVISIHGMSSSCFTKRDETISKKVNEIGMDFLSFNNRGHDVISYLKEEVDGKIQKRLAGVAYEDVLESKYDIEGAILWALENGYQKIYLQGHSLGCTKIVYAYQTFLKENKKNLLNAIDGILLLSLVDIPTAQKVYLGEQFKKYQDLAEKLEKEGKEKKIMPFESFIHPISVKTYLRYSRDNKEINFARYSEPNYSFPELNAISVPLFMRWGTDREMILQKASDLVEYMKGKIQNKEADISYIDGADHSYTGKEELLAEQIQNFLRKMR